MADRNPRYPVPDRSNDQLHQEACREVNPEIEFGRQTGVMPDGRPAVVEDWYNSETDCFCRTFFCSSLDIKGWTDDQHRDFILDSGLLDSETLPSKEVAVLHLRDAAENEVVSVKLVLHASHMEK